MPPGCRTLIAAGVLAWSSINAAACAAAPPALFDAMRSQNCPHRTGTQIGLHPDVKLDQAAQQLARGSPLAAALASVGYRAERSVSIMVAQRVGDAESHALLQERICAALTDVRLSAFGLFERAREVWVVLAAPFAPPSIRDAAAVHLSVLELTNRARAQARHCGLQSLPPAPPLRLNPFLELAALEHARDMAAQAQMTHRGSDGSMPADRATRAGYKWRAVGENIAAGAVTAGQVVQNWLNSPGHCANLMSKDFTEMGLAYVVTAAGEPGIYWAQVFGRPQ